MEYRFGFYCLVHGRGTGGARIRHDSIEEAREEAQRLYGLNDGKADVSILQTLEIIRSPETVPVTPTQARRAARKRARQKALMAEIAEIDASKPEPEDKGPVVVVKKRRTIQRGE